MGRGFLFILKCCVLAGGFSFSFVGSASPVRPVQVRPTPKFANFDTGYEINLALTRIFENLGNPNVAPGVVIASPSHEDPNYFYHWTRDAGMTIATITPYAGRYPGIKTYLQKWAGFERLAQANAAKTPFGLGEPKFETDGRVYPKAWGRPQNDGPAIRAWAYLNAFGAPDEMVDADMEFLRLHWQDLNVDLWEEVSSNHFFTRYAQMAAFRTAAAAYGRVGNQAKAQAYATEATRVEASLNAFIDSTRFQVVPSVGSYVGVQKPAGLDISTILAVLYFGPAQRWSVSQSFVLATALHLEETFRAKYAINQMYPDMAPGIGRYPEDVYDGNTFTGGNPWFLGTFGMAEFYCTLAADLSKAGVVQFDKINAPFYQKVLPSLTPRANLVASQPEFASLVGKMHEKGWSYIQRAMFHAGEDRRYSEQFDRNTGFRRGARDLTWSYASAVRAFQRCDQSAQLTRRFRK